MSSNFAKDLEDFHLKFGLKYEGGPRALPAPIQSLRFDLLMEELKEYMDAASHAYDITTQHPGFRDQADYTHQLEESLDGLVDLVYVALGTAYLHGFDFQSAWDRVHEANMKKIRAPSAQASKRGSTFDVVKPEGWEPPTHTDLVEDNDCMDPHLDRA